MLPPFPPVLAHSTWSLMLKAFRTEHPSLQALSASELKYCLTPAASIAWWICTFKPELLERTQLHLLLPGVSIIECADQGRWLQFIPWLVGQPNLAVSAALVGDELYVDADRRPSSGKGLSKKEQKKQWAINAEHLVKPKAPAQITNGTLADWNTFSNSLPDLCVLFAPGFASHYKTWLTEEDLLPLLRARVPTAVFYYSELDCVADSFILEACGLTQENTETKLNPWRQVHEREYETGGFAQFAGNLAVPNISYPLVFDKEKLKVFIQTESYLSAEYAEGGGDAALLRIGTKFIYEREGHTFSPPRMGRTQDYAFVLPYFLLIMESDGAVVYRAETEDGFVDTYQMRLPPSLLIGWPFKNPFQRLIAAVHLHRDIIQPILKEMNPDVDADEEEELDFMLAMMGGDINLLTFFKHAISEMNGLPPKKKKDATKRNSFFRAIANADFDKAQALATKNPALLHATDNEGKTALMRAYDADNTPLLFKWVSEDALIDILDNEGYGLIHDVIRKNDVITLEHLLWHEANPNFSSLFGFTPANMCLSYGAFDCLASLVDAHADLRTESIGGTSVAAVFETLDISEELKQQIRDLLTTSS